MELNKFFAVILPMFVISVFYLISHEAFAQNETQKINVYEGLGLKMNYFDPWEIGVKIDDPSCLICSTTLKPPNFEGMVGIFQHKFDDPKIKNKCQCYTLLEFVKYVYEDTISKNADLVFINDNQTTLTDGNIIAIQMEYENKADTMIGQNLLYIFIKGPNSFYTIIFSADKNEQYSKYLDDFKKMVNSVEFVSTNESKIQKQPSFMMDTKESNNTSLLQSLANENGLDLSNNAKQQLSESLASNNKIEVASHYSVINSIGQLHVIGEVENNSPLIAEFVKIIGTFYDDNGDVVGTEDTYTDPTNIESGEKAPFDLILSDSPIPVEQINHYRLTISYR